MKVGTYEIPDYRLIPTMIESTKIIYDKFKGENAPDNLTVANLLGHKSVSGSLLTKLGNLRSYGLIEKRGIKVTELGKNITYPINEEARDEAIRQAILNIPLWAELYRKFGVNLPRENFWVDLKQITGLEAPESQKLADMVRNYYIDDTKYLNIVEKSVPPADSKSQQARAEDTNDRKDVMDTLQVNLKSGTIPFTQFQFGESKVVIADRAHLDIISGFLSNLKDTLDKQNIPLGKPECKPEGTKENKI